MTDYTLSPEELRNLELNSIFGKKKMEIHDDATDESVGYEYKNYKLHSEQIISCPSCSQKLVSILIVKKNCPCIVLPDGTEWQNVKIRAECPKCKIPSFNILYERCKLFYQACPGKSIVNANMDTPGLITLEMK